MVFEADIKMKKQIQIVLKLKRNANENMRSIKLVMRQIAGIHPKYVNPNRMRREVFPKCCYTFELVHGAEINFKYVQLKNVIYDFILGKLFYSNKSAD